MMSKILVELEINGTVALSVEIPENLVPSTVKHYGDWGRMKSEGFPWAVFVMRKSKFSKWSGTDISSEQIKKALNHFERIKHPNNIQGRISKKGRIHRKPANA